MICFLFKTTVYKNSVYRRADHASIVRHRSAVPRVGTATVGNVRINGGTGSDGQTGSSLFPGNGGASFFGGGGRAGAQAGIAGTASGSGGGGAYDLGFTSTAYTGGDGADGILILEEFA